MLCWLITICTIARLWIVISWFVWMLWTREEVSLTDSAGIRERERGTEGGSESERIGWHSRFANENEGRRAEVSLNDSAGIRDSRTRTRGGGRKWVWTTHWMIHRYRKHDWTNRTNDSLNDSPLPETRLNERTNERTNDSFWWTERRELIRGKESWNPPLAPISLFVSLGNIREAWPPWHVIEATLIG